MNQLIIAPSPDLIPAPLFTPTPRAAKRVIEFFTAQVSNDHTRRMLFSRSRPFLSTAHAKDTAQERRTP